MRIKSLSALFSVLAIAGCNDDSMDMSRVVEARPIDEPVYGDPRDINKECLFVLSISKQSQAELNYTDMMETARAYFVAKTNFNGVTEQQITDEYLPKYSENNNKETLDLTRVEAQAVKCAYSPMLQR